MGYRNRKDPFCVWYGLVDLPDPDEFCAVCGGPIWADETVEIQDNKICHAKCVEKEDG